MIDIGNDPVTGKHKQKGIGGFKTKYEAESAAAALIYEVEEGMYVEETNQTFSAFSKEWLTIYRVSKDVKPGTIRVRLHEISKLMPYFA
jgi:hypothetical protein